MSERMEAHLKYLRFRLRQMINEYVFREQIGWTPAPTMSQIHTQIDYIREVEAVLSKRRNDRDMLALNLREGKK